MNQKSKLTFGKIFERFAYGCGDFGCNIIYTAMSAFLLFYYTDYAGVSAMAVGTIMMISRVFDGISDIYHGCYCRPYSFKVWKSKTVDPTYVYPICNIRHPDVFGSGFLVIHTEAGLRIYYI